MMRVLRWRSDTAQNNIIITGVDLHDAVLLLQNVGDKRPHHSPVILRQTVDCVVSSPASHAKIEIKPDDVWHAMMQISATFILASAEVGVRNSASTRDPRGSGDVFQCMYIRTAFMRLRKCLSDFHRSISCCDNLGMFSTSVRTPVSRSGGTSAVQLSRW